VKFQVKVIYIVVNFVVLWCQNWKSQIQHLKFVLILCDV